MWSGGLNGIVDVPCKKSAVRRRILEWIKAWMQLARDVILHRTAAKAHLGCLDVIVKVVSEGLNVRDDLVPLLRRQVSREENYSVSVARQNRARGSSPNVT